MAEELPWQLFQKHNETPFSKSIAVWFVQYLVDLIV